MALVYQAFVDDSDSGAGGPFVLAGLIAPAEGWAAFSDEWAEELARNPAIQYFKTTEAVNRRGQFDRWSVPDRDEKVRRLIAIVEKYALFGIGSLLDNDDYRAVFKGKIAPAMDYPYTLAFYGVMQALFAVQEREGVSQPVDFIFDEQGKQIGRALEAWKHWVEFAPDRYKPMIGRRPVSGDDKTDLPLQGADIVAWKVRREWVEKRTGGDFAKRFVPWSISTKVDVWTREAMRFQMDHFQDFKRVTGRRFLYEP